MAKQLPPNLISLPPLGPLLSSSMVKPSQPPSRHRVKQRPAPKQWQTNATPLLLTLVKDWYHGGNFFGHDLISGAVYLGDRTTNGSWRIIPEGVNLVVQKRESGLWVTKSTITP